MNLKKSFAMVLALAAGLTPATAQSDNTILMTINGKPVSVGEFMYSYNKNGNISGAVEQKTVGEYVDMFINYKLKVAAAEDARLDTVAAFKEEFLKYRDMQLTPFMVDEVFIDSVARSMYKGTADRLKGMDMLRPAHILISLKSSAGAAEAAAAEQRADSVYNALLQGANFAELARKYSGDAGSAVRGGELPWIGPGMTLAEFEKAAYALAKGELSRPVKTAVGYHVIKMLDRKQLEPYDSLKAPIVAGLKRQGIEEISAENRIRKIVAASNGRLTREAVLDSVLAAQTAGNSDLRYLVQEYHDGLLLYEISRKYVWDKIASDAEEMQALFKKNRKKYAWEEPRWRGFVIHMKDPAMAKKAKKVLKEYANDDWRAALKREINVDSIIVRVQGPYVCKKGENDYVDNAVFKGEAPRVIPGFPHYAVYGKKLKQPKQYTDVKPQVEADYQEILEKAWVEELRGKYTFEVNRSVLQQLEK